MKLSRLTLLLAAYVSLDVSNPLMPGALCFSVEDSVEARRTDPVRIYAGTSALPLALSKPLTPPEPGVERSRLVAAVNPHFPRAHVTRSDPSPPASASTED
ncbi:MAG: hypothetical protein ACREKH_00800 [Candidatus Rokuibacteriota bacterium]